MTQRIIYQTTDGGVAIIIPSGEMSIEEVARKDVPAGVQFKIIDTTEVPDDRTFRSAWEADMTSPHGTGIGQQAWFIEQYQKEIDAITSEPLPDLLPDQDYTQVVSQFEQSRTQRIAQLNQQIAVQQAEMSQ